MPICGECVVLCVAVVTNSVAICVVFSAYSDVPGGYHGVGYSVRVFDSAYPQPPPP